MAVRSVLFLTARPGRRTEVIEAYRRLEILESAVQQANCSSSELQVPEDPEAALLVTALWRRKEDYDAWRAHPLRERYMAELAPLLAGVPSGEVYWIELSAPRQVIDSLWEDST
jgi:hypothetical protein